MASAAATAAPAAATEAPAAAGGSSAATPRSPAGAGSAGKFSDCATISAASVPSNGKVALVTGITGQDGSYLAELLICKGYTVHGLIRRSSSFNVRSWRQRRGQLPACLSPPHPPHPPPSRPRAQTGRIEHLYQDKHSTQVRLFLEYGDLSDASNLCELLARIRPHELYNLAAQSHVKVSFEMSEYTANVDGLGTLRLLNAIRACGLERTCKFYQASTSELYGQVREVPQSETTPFYPRSPYAVAKQFAFWMCVNYRESYGSECC